jgi:hypothetical protein
MKFSLKLTATFFLLLGSALNVGAQASEVRNLWAATAESCANAKQLPGVAPAACRAFDIERRQVSGNVYEYTFALRVGEGEHDVIKVHRVVREDEAGRPSQTEHAVLMVHGDIWGFDAAFLGNTISAHAPAGQSVGLYLASKGVDVWGIDLRWTQVPAATTDFTFMKDWNIATHVGDIAVALSVARGVRGATGSGTGQLALLGWSRGGILAYAYANAETRLPENLRQVKALVPVDIAYKFAPEHETQRAAACRRYASARQQRDLGVYQSSLGAGVGVIGTLAAADPGGVSTVPGFAGLTNAQAALLLASRTHLLFANDPPVPSYHFNAGVFNLLGLPTKLQYTPEAYLYDFLAAGHPYQSSTEIMESEALLCDEIDVPYDDYLGEIRIPVLYVGAAGGFGEYGLDTLEQLGGSDVSSLVVRLHASDARDVEFGHADLFLAENARDVVWKPLRKWLVSR